MNRIRELRENFGLHQTDVANATGIDQKTLSNYETGKTNSDSCSLIQLADFFDVSIDYLVGRINSLYPVVNKEDIYKKPMPSSKNSMTSKNIYKFLSTYKSM